MIQCSWRDLSLGIDLREHLFRLSIVEILLVLCVDGNKNILHTLTYCAAVCAKRIRNLGHLYERIFLNLSFLISRIPEFISYRTAAGVLQEEKWWRKYRKLQVALDIRTTKKLWFSAWGVLYSILFGVTPTPKVFQRTSYDTLWKREIQICQIFKSSPHALNTK